MENMEEDYKDRNIHILKDNQAAITALHNLQTNSKLVWDCQQFLVELAEHKGFNWYGCWDTWELMEMKYLNSWLQKVPHIHWQDLSLHLEYLWRLQGE